MMFVQRALTIKFINPPDNVLAVSTGFILTEIVIQMTLLEGS
jgi:hypothetical protein